MPIERAKMHLRAICGPEVRCKARPQSHPPLPSPTTTRDLSHHPQNDTQDLDTVTEGLKKLGIEAAAAAVPGAQQDGEGGAARRQQLDMLVDPGLFRQVCA